MKTPVTTPPESFDAERKLACPKCGSTDLATLEEILGGAGCSFYVNGEMAHDGYTEVYWDASTSIGVECKTCHWDARDSEDPDGSAVNLLIPQAFQCNYCGDPVFFEGGQWLHGESPHYEGRSFECIPDDPDDEGVATPVLAD